MLTVVSDNNLWQHELCEGDEIAVERGVLWLTVGAQDVVLRKGERFRLEAPATVMGQALSINKNGPHAVFRLYHSTSTEQTAKRFGRTLFERIPFFRAFHPLGRYRLSR
jgi:hypothetical protein